MPTDVISHRSNFHLMSRRVQSGVPFTRQRVSDFSTRLFTLGLRLFKVELGHAYLRDASQRSHVERTRDVERLCAFVSGSVTHVDRIVVVACA